MAHTADARSNDWLLDWLERIQRHACYFFRKAHRQDDLEISHCLRLCTHLMNFPIRHNAVITCADVTTLPIYSPYAVLLLSFFPSLQSLPDAVPPALHMPVCKTCRSPSRDPLAAIKMNTFLVSSIDLRDIFSIDPLYTWNINLTYHGGKDRVFSAYITLRTCGARDETDRWRKVGHAARCNWQLYTRSLALYY